MVARPAAKLLAAFALPALLGGLALACPAREEKIQITPAGFAQLAAACVNPCAVKEDPKDSIACAGKGPMCGFDQEQLLCRRNDACMLPGHPAPNLLSDTRIRLMLVDPEKQKIRAKSDCAPLLPCKQFDEKQAQLACVAEGMNRALDGAIAGGLTFDDLEDPSTVLPVLAVYQSAASEADAGEATPCAIGDLIACAGLAVPVGGDGDYDITCAACQNGLANPPGIDNGPCPREMQGVKTTSCFLEGCASLLEQL